MILTRTHDASFLNEVANDPTVRPFVGGEGQIVVTIRPDDVALQGTWGGFLFQHLAPGLYEVHSLALPSGRGGWMRAAMLEARDTLFSTTNCVELVTKIPGDNAPAAGLAKAAGLREQFRRDDTAYLSMSWLDAAMLSGACLAEGERFHDWLKSVGADSDHADDPAHDRIVGASLLRARGGLPSVAVSLYNRWAIFAGYAPIRLVSEAPIEFDTVDAIVRLHGDGTLELLDTCPSARS